MAALNICWLRGTAEEAHLLHCVAGGSPARATCGGCSRTSVIPSTAGLGRRTRRSRCVQLSVSLRHAAQAIGARGLGGETVAQHAVLKSPWTNLSGLTLPSRRLFEAAHNMQQAEHGAVASCHSCNDDCEALLSSLQAGCSASSAWDGRASHIIPQLQQSRRMHYYVLCFCHHRCGCCWG